MLLAEPLCELGWKAVRRERILCSGTCGTAPAYPLRQMGVDNASQQCGADDGGTRPATCGIRSKRWTRRPIGGVFRDHLMLLRSDILCCQLRLQVGEVGLVQVTEDRARFGWQRLEPKSDPLVLRMGRNRPERGCGAEEDEEDGAGEPPHGPRLIQTQLS